MKHNIRFIFYLIVSVACTLGYSQEPHPIFKQYTVEDGLPSSEVYQVKQDSKGYMWFATGNGVSRFNGYEFENFSLEDGLPDNTVFEIFEDCVGRIWFVPLSCKLSYYENGKIQLYKYNKALQARLKARVKSSFYVDSAGTVFLGVAGDGIYKIDRYGTIQHSPGSDLDLGLEIIEPEQGKLVFATSRSYTQTIHIQFNTNSFKGYAHITFVDQRYGIIKVLLTADNRLLFAWQNELYIFTSPVTYQVKKISAWIIWLYEDKDGDIWIGTQYGVYYMEKDLLGEGKLYLPGFSVNGITQDAEGGFWFATEGNHVFYTPSKKMLTYADMGGFTDNRITCLGTDGVEVYAGRRNGFIHSIRDNKLITYNNNIKKGHVNYIQNLFYDPIKKRLIISGVDGGGFLKNGKLFPSGLFRACTRLLIDVHKNYWTVTSVGIQKASSDRQLWDREKQMKIQSKWSIRTNALLMINDHELWLGTLKGLWRYNDKNGEFTDQSMLDPLFSSRILDLDYSYDSSWVLMGTKGNGLLLYNYKKTYQLSTENGLCGNNVYNLWIDGPCIWAATNGGLNKIILHDDPADCSIHSYTAEDGIASNEINDVVITLNHQIWVATNAGLSVFSEEDILEKNDDLPIYITGLQINDSLVNMQEKYILDHSQNNFKINFVGLGYKKAGKHLYRYKMEGLDTSWTYTQNREIQFTTLPPDHYKFTVAVQNTNGTWSHKTTTIEFIILTPFWQKWWFILSVVVVAILLFSLLFFFRIKQIRKKEKKNAEINKALLSLKLKALRAQMNPHFTFNVMNSIQHFIVDKNEDVALHYLSNFSKLIRTILNNSEEDSVSLNEEISALELYLELEVMRFEQQISYDIYIDSSIDRLQTKIPSMLLQPYVENAIHHGLLPLKNRKGMLKIEISKLNGLLKCVIEDNGIGRTKAAEQKPAIHYRSFGTSITKERLKLMNSLHNNSLYETIIDLTDMEGNAIGTRVEIYIPLTN